MNKRVFKYTLNDIAAYTGKSIHSVRDDRQKGRFDAEDLLSVSKYIVSYHLLEEEKK